MKTKSIFNLLLLLLTFSMLVFSSCNSSRKVYCGCPGKRGLGGYN